MSHVRTRPTIQLLAVAVCLAALAAPALFAVDSAVEARAAGTVVERYEAESTIYFASSTKGGRSTGQVVADKLRFESGSRSFSGSSVELAGREGELASLAGSFAAEPSVESESVVQGTASLVSTDGESAAAEFVGVGGAFSVQDLSQGDTFKGSGQITSYDKAALPELGGADLYFHSTYTITGVDAVNGVATAACAGELEAVQQATPASLAARLGSLGAGGSLAGAGLLVVGLCGFGVTTWRRR